MRCPNCKKKISDSGISFCSKCGAYVKNIDKIKSNKKGLFSYLVIFLIWIISIYTITNIIKIDYYFKEPDNIVIEEDNTEQNNETEETKQTPQNETPQPSNKEESIKPITTTKGVTVIEYDHKYLKQFSINSIDDVYNYIRKDSNDQKQKCPNEIRNIENEIINNYGIIAVNLCEMDMTFAKEVSNVAGYIYNNYPSARGHITNLTLANLDDNSNYMAAYMPIFTFLTNNSATGYPMGIKSQIILNAKYFLDKEKIQNSAKYGSTSGYFPKNATRSSTVAHEFGHYLSFVAMLKYYQTNQLTFINTSLSSLLYKVYDDFNSGNFSYKIIESAYQEYQLNYGNTLNFDEFRNSISTYAVAKDSNGEYIYDETIAEAFHDCYLNGDNAQIASKLIMNKIKNYL